MTKGQFKKQVRACLRDSMKVLDRRLNSLISSGAVNLPDANMVDCKAATVAFLLSEANQFTPPDTAMLRRFNAVVRNMRANL
jgi:hypothetical protein